MFTQKSIKAAMRSAVAIALLLTFSHAVLAVQAPSFSLPGSSGVTTLKDNVSLDRYKGKVVYVDFWASWCEPCKKSFPWMNQMHERYASQGLTIIAINLDENRSKADDFLQQNPANFTIAYDAEGKTAEKYDLSVMPSSYLVDGKGNIVMAHRGFKSQDKQVMESKIREFLSTK